MRFPQLIFSVNFICDVTTNDGESSLAADLSCEMEAAIWNSLPSLRRPKYAPAIRHKQAVFLGFPEALDMHPVDGVETLRNQHVE